MATRLEHVLAHLVPPQQLRQQGLLAARAASSGDAILPPTALRVPAVPKAEWPESMQKLFIGVDNPAEIFKATAGNHPAFFEAWLRCDSPPFLLAAHAARRAVARVPGAWSSVPPPLALRMRAGGRITSSSSPR